MIELARRLGSLEHNLSHLVADICFETMHWIEIQSCGNNNFNMQNPDAPGIYRRIDWRGSKVDAGFNTIRCSILAGSIDPDSRFGNWGSWIRSLRDMETIAVKPKCLTEPKLCWRKICFEGNGTMSVQNSEAGNTSSSVCIA